MRAFPGLGRAENIWLPFEAIGPHLLQTDLHHLSESTCAWFAGAFHFIQSVQICLVIWGHTLHSKVKTCTILKRETYSSYFSAHTDWIWQHIANIHSAVRRKWSCWGSLSRDLCWKSNMKELGTKVSTQPPRHVTEVRGSCRGHRGGRAAPLLLICTCWRAHTHTNTVRTLTHTHTRFTCTHCFCAHKPTSPK